MSGTEDLSYMVPFLEVLNRIILFDENSADGTRLT